MKQEWSRWNSLLYVIGELADWEVCQLEKAVASVKQFDGRDMTISLIGIPQANGSSLEKILSEKAILPAECLMVVATDSSLEFARSYDMATLAYQSPLQSRQRFEGEKMLVEGLEEINQTFLQRQYERYHGIPWTIAETNRCIIRELTLSDLPALFELYAEPHVTDYMEPLYEWEEEMEYQKAYIEKIYHYYGFGMWLVFEKETGQLIGRAGIEVRENIELGYVIFPRWQRKGYATEVCRRIIDYAAEELDIHTIHCMIQPENAPSIALASKLGFTFVGKVHMNQQEFAHYILSCNYCFFKKNKI